VVCIIPVHPSGTIDITECVGTACDYGQSCEAQEDPNWRETGWVKVVGGITQE